MAKHKKVNLRMEDIKSIIEVYELIKFERGYLIDSEEKKTFSRIIRQCKKSLENE